MSSEPPFNLRTENVWFGYQPDECVLKDISLALPNGSFNMVMGASGSGKTTLLKVLGGFLPHQRGKIYLFGEETNHPLPGVLRARIGYIPQQLGLVRSLTVLDNVLMGALSRCRSFSTLLGFFPKKEIEHARMLLAQLGIAHKAGEKIIHLSGGERQRVAIGRTLMQKPSIILAGEFVSDLDLKTASEILSLMQQIGRKDHVTFLMSMHELQLVKEFNGSVIVIKDGNISGACPSNQFDRAVLEELLR